MGCLILLSELPPEHLFPQIIILYDGSRKTIKYNEYVPAQNNRHDTNMYRYLIMRFFRYGIWLEDGVW